MAVTANEKITSNTAGVQNAKETCILKVLAYFDVFQYPLTKNEIRQYLGRPFTEASLDDMLQQLLTHQTIFLHNDFYSLHNNPSPAQRRKDGNLRAEKLLPKAIRIGRFLSYFPYVRAIAISGSLSKNFADEKADIDFFIITKANRLWIARTIMHVFKKLTFLTGHQHFFCMNYYIDEEVMLIEDQNIFTAIEIMTLVPVSGMKVLNEFFIINNWCHNFFPTSRQKKMQSDKPREHWGKKIIEKVFDNSIGDSLENRFFKITAKRWRQKYLDGKLNKNGSTMKLITGKHFARSNPGAFQEKVLALYEQKLIDLKLVNAD